MNQIKDIVHEDHDIDHHVLTYIDMYYKLIKKIRLKQHLMGNQIQNPQTLNELYYPLNQCTSIEDYFKNVGDMYA